MLEIKPLSVNKKLSLLLEQPKIILVMTESEAFKALNTNDSRDATPFVRTASTKFRIVDAFPINTFEMAIWSRTQGVIAS